MEVLRCCLRCPCKWLAPPCVKDAEQEELRYKLHRHRRRRAALRRLEERREEAQREEERERERVREKVLLHQQFRHLYRSERLTSTSHSTLDASVSPSSRGSLHPTQDILSIFSDPHILLDSSPEGCQGAAALQEPEKKEGEEREEGCGSEAGCDGSCFQQEPEGRYGASKWVSCLPRVEEEATDEAEHEQEKEEKEEEDETVDSYFLPYPRPHSLLTPTPDSITHSATKGGGQRFSLMSYTDWLRDGGLKSSVPTPIHTLTSLRRARSEPKLPQASSKNRLLARSHEAQCLNQTPSASKVRHGRKRSKDRKDDAGKKDGDGRHSDRSTGASHRSNRASTTTARHRDDPQQGRERARHTDETQTARERPARPKSTRKKSRKGDKQKYISTSTSSTLPAS
ncbi:X-linked retinitis pigmentosa GTPase regulator-interacting protein 1-like, partial [Eriocheir sinensis]|uniref:X-linked retinitis pigmentosa GTPase regulator-interacting protein 1-like n=1 Tax=Eriocheir sinensis TaxID=95602 RepID=UPI0021C5B853